MYEPRRKVLWFAIVTRLSVLFLQFIFNILCPDHNADAFKIPATDVGNNSICDNIITYLLSGLTRWDGEYYMHIAKYGYTYENTLAFYPLYPTIVRITAAVIRRILCVLNIHSSVMLAAVLINFVCFVKSAIIFYDLSKAVLKKTNVAYKAAILYCINPATIFFSAAYSESLFAYLTFYSMFRSIKFDSYVSFPLGLAILVRSNGMVTVGFPIYYGVKKLFCNYFMKYKNYTWRTLSQFMFTTVFFRKCCFLLNIIIVSLAPFLLLQIYNYILFCIPDSNQLHVPLHVKNYGLENNLVLPGNGSAEWCQAKIPLSYSYIQNKYWNVGFLKYYEFKQIPNFVLALPVLFIMALCIKEYYIQHKRYFYTLGLLEDIQNEKYAKPNEYPAEMLVFIVHGLFLTIFCTLFVHIQVSTRLICSASPLVYWYCAKTMSYAPSSNNKNDTAYENGENIVSRWKVFFMSQRKYTTADKLILSYFLGYAFIGCFMFSNFLPWT